MPVQQNIDAPVRRPKSYPFSGRLIVLERGKIDPLDTFTGVDTSLSIDFPAQPNEIVLERIADYTVTTNIVIPDGVHQYTGTQPLVIPVSFDLHADDEDYCPEGALTILQLAARLQSFALPISTVRQNSVLVQAGIGGFANGNQTVSPTEATDEALGNNAQGAETTLDFSTDDADEIYPPVTLRLELIYTENDLPGIVCNGYVKDVNVKLHGPFRRGPNLSRNLPLSATYSFSFVHVPGYGNNFNRKSTNLGFQAQAFADVVRERLYNTRDLAQDANFRGFDGGPAQTTNQSAAPTQVQSSQQLESNTAPPGQRRARIRNTPGGFVPEF